ncbi:glycosyltransferase [Lonepinella sp. MS14435]|uniref:glycosyltransferase family protein n=1 Tax=Lonepinella sp. MS14435 TaxID=3003618 RepID=UPI0036DA9556
MARKKRNVVVLSSANKPHVELPIEQASDSVVVQDEIKALKLELREWLDTQTQQYNLLKDAYQQDLHKYQGNIAFLEKQLKELSDKYKKKEAEFQAIKDKTSQAKKKAENTLSFKLGNTLINSTKSFGNFFSLPMDLWKLRSFLKNKKDFIELPNVARSVFDASSEAVKKITEKKLNFNKGLTLLDPISELCWKNEFIGFPLVRSEFEKQINNSTAGFAFFESAWRANKGSWIYAFTSPELKHNNAQALLAAIDLLKQRKIPIIFWNKEDPMHYEMFKPIARYADYIFTTDALVVDKYKKELGNENVWALPFAAPIKTTNPTGRFSLDTESVCFAGTYYAQNHENRKKQMDIILPALLSNNGAIYDRASKDTSGKYAYPQQYQEIVRDGVDFNEMMSLYKKFKVFLNVNTITQSTTMMSRRVYELIASGTPVVSTPSKAITEQFPGIVITVNNEYEAELAVKKLLNDSYYWHKQSTIGIREVMAHHTYEKRWEYIQSVINGYVEEVSLPKIQIIALYHGYIPLDTFIESLINQANVEIKDIILVKPDRISINESDLEKYKCVKLSRLSEFNLKKYVSPDSEYTFLTDDRVINYRQSIYGLFLSFTYSEYSAVSRSLYYRWNEISKNNDYSIDNPNWYQAFSDVSTSCVLLKNSDVDKFLFDINKKTFKLKNGDKGIFMIDPFNVLFIGSTPIESKEKINNIIYQTSSYLGV